jgi:hypothetical protein
MTFPMVTGMRLAKKAGQVKVAKQPWPRRPAALPRPAAKLQQAGMRAVPCEGLPRCYRTDGAHARQRAPLRMGAVLQLAPAVAAYTKPNVAGAKECRFGSTLARPAASTPNQLASVAAYWSTDVVGIQRPSVPSSSGPASPSVGQVP